MNYTPEQMRKISVAYLASGNSVNDLCEQLIETLHKGDPDPFGAFFKEIVDDMVSERKNAPESFETTVETELQILEETANDHEYETNSCAWG